MSKWISVSEKLPVKYTDVLAVVANKYGKRIEQVAWVSTDNGDWDSDQGIDKDWNVTHWMELPKMPGEV